MRTALRYHILVLCVFARIAGFAAPNLTFAPHTNVVLVGTTVTWTLGGGSSGFLAWAKLDNIGPSGTFEKTIEITNKLDIAKLRSYSFVPNAPGDYQIILRCLTEGKSPFYISNTVSVLPFALSLILDRASIFLGQSTECQIAINGQPLRDHITSLADWEFEIRNNTGTLFTNVPPSGRFPYHANKAGNDTLQLTMRKAGTRFSAEANVFVEVPAFRMTVIPSEGYALGDPDGILIGIETSPPAATDFPVQLTISENHVTVHEARLLGRRNERWLPKAPGRFEVKAALQIGSITNVRYAVTNVDVRADDFKLTASPARVIQGESIKLEVTSQFVQAKQWLSSQGSSQTTSELLWKYPEATGGLSVADYLMNSKPLRLDVPGRHTFSLISPLLSAKAEVVVEPIPDGIPSEKALPVDVIPDRPFLIEVPVPKFPYRQVELAFVVDLTGSMRNEIDAVQAAIPKIFQAAKEIAPDVRCGVFGYGYDTGVMSSHVVNLKRVAEFTTNASALSQMTINATGEEEVPFKSLQLTASLPDWHSTSVKVMCLLTDDTDQVYNRDAANAKGQTRSRLGNKRQLLDVVNAKVPWREGELSILQILHEIRDKGFSVAALVSEDDIPDLTRQYKDVFDFCLGSSFIGAYKLENVDVLVNDFRVALRRLLAQKTMLQLKQRNDSSTPIEITAADPISCRSGAGFSYQKLKDEGHEKMSFSCTSRAKLPVGASFLLEAVNEDGVIFWRRPVLNVPSK